LDDEELSFLGASWSEYSVAASKLGLDVLRIPTPEGLAPLDPKVINEHMDFLIANYTLKGVNVLVHCRGGVGRAGLISCCWMLKLGLCGAVRGSLGRGNGNIGGFLPGGGVRRDTLELVERIVSVVRRRRSIKAIETYEQVRFLVDFVEFLRSGSIM
jgi:protein-tyrosine phosphatase